jgi:hypothetical protein
LGKPVLLRSGAAPEFEALIRERFHLIAKNVGGGVLNQGFLKERLGGRRHGREKIPRSNGCFF